MKYLRGIRIQAIVAMIWSLYYSNFGDPVQNIIDRVLFDHARWFTPCTLCRRARICMYPIVALATVALRRRDKKGVYYILPLSIIGIGIELYQYRFQISNTIEQVKSTICGRGSGASCAATDVIYGWFITIPFLCLVAFIIITTLALLHLRREKKQEKDMIMPDTSVE